MSDYQDALEAAGATVSEFVEFGSYQGDWFARIGGAVVAGTYGSCSGCDAFRSEFGYGTDGWCDEHYYHPRSDCLACTAAIDRRRVKLASFGAEYLDGAVAIGSPEWDALIAAWTKQVTWDTDAADVLAWLNSQVGP